jgi:oligoendopeptidase F
MDHPLETAQDLEKRLTEVWSYIHCLLAQDTEDEQARILSGKTEQLAAEFQTLKTQLESRLAQISDETWDRLCNDKRIKPIAFNLHEMRERALGRLPQSLEALASYLSVDGYHAWGQLYNTVVSRIQIPVAENGETLNLSVSQAANKFSHPDRSIRKRVFAEWERAMHKEAGLLSAILNHLAGFRLQLYKQRGWEDVLHEPLTENRMKRETLETMWSVVTESKSALGNYLHRKARLLGLSKLSWYDLSAPLPGENRVITFDEAACFIIDQFAQFSPDLAQFAQKAFTKRWIEAEDHPNKRAGGFCTPFPVSGESRIFMTFAGTANNLSTLAHELGHGYHQHVMNDLPMFAQNYAMNVAETASTFAEMIVSDAVIKRAQTKEERVALLDERLRRGLGYFLDIHSRFLFETRFYHARRQGLVRADELCRMMEEAQRESFNDLLEEYHPHFWASKLHFYHTHVPFYNFPYTFGFLFSTGIYAQAQQEGKSFAHRYVRLLRDTGRMTVEDLARKHLGVDLTKPDFWRMAVEFVLKEVNEFLLLTE